MNERRIQADRRAFWADKTANAAHCAALEQAADKQANAKASAMQADWFARFQIAKAVNLIAN